MQETRQAGTDIEDRATVAALTTMLIARLTIISHLSLKTVRLLKLCALNFASTSRHLPNRPLLKYLLMLVRSSKTR